MSVRNPFMGGVAFAALATLGGVLVSRAEPASKTRWTAFAMYRIDWGQKPFPNIHIRRRDGSENIINHKGGWERRHGGRDLPPMPKGRKARGAIRRIAKPFVKRASKMIPVAGLLFMANDLYAMSQNPCPGIEDIIELFAPVQAVTDLVEYIIRRQ